MAVEKVKTVDIETAGAAKSLADLRKQINEAKDALYGMTEGTEEYNKKILELGYAQAEMNSFMALTRQGCTALEGSYNALSYLMGLLKQEYKETADEARRNELAELISGLNDQLKDMDAAVGVFSRNVGNYTGAMNDVFGKLGITVGNLGPLFNTFANSAAEAGAKGKSAFTGLASGAKSLGASLKALAANPVGAVIMAIVVAVKALFFIFEKVKESIERNEESMDNLKLAMAPIKAIINGITAAFDALVEACTRVAAAIGGVIDGFLSWVGVGGDGVSTLEMKIAKMEKTIAKEHRKNIVDNARLELQASEARAKAAEKDKYNDKQRLELITEYAKKQQQIAANKLKEAEHELELLNLQALTGANNAEMNDKIAKALAKVLEVLTAYNSTLRETNSLVAALKDGIKKQAEEAQKAYKKSREDFKKLVEKVTDELITNNYTKQRVAAKRENKEQLKELDELLKKKAISINEYNEMVARVNLAYFQKRKKLNEEELKDINNYANQINSLNKSDSLNKIEAEAAKWNDMLMELMDRYTAGLIKSEEEYINAYNTITAAAANATNKLRDEEYVNQKKDRLDKTVLIANAETELELSLLEERYKRREITTKEFIEQSYNERLENIAKQIEAEEFYRSELDRMYEKGLISKEAYDAAIVESDTVATNLQIQNLDLLKEKQNLAIDTLINALSGMMDIMNDFASNISSIGDGISSKWGNVFSNMSSMVNEVGSALKSGEQGFGTWAKVGAAACSTVSSVFGALADEQDENSEEGFEAAKKLRYGEALFSMASGIMSVWPAAMELGVPAGPIMGSLLTAMITGMGIAQLALISKTQYGDTSSTASTASASGVSASIVSPVQYMSEVTPASQENTGTDNRVYVVESDISSTQNRVNVAQSEATY